MVRRRSDAIQTESPTPISVASPGSIPIHAKSGVPVVPSLPPVVEVQTGLISVPDGNEAWGFPPLDVEGRKSEPTSALEGPGFELVLTRGPNTYSPVKYNSFTVGPVSVRIQPGDQESISATYARADAMVSALYDAEYSRAFNVYIADLRRSVAQVKACSTDRG
jgi:hypothetical protein